MKRTRCADQLIIGILAEHEAGAKCADLCRKHGMSEGSFYNCKAQFGGVTVSEAKRLRALEDENAKSWPVELPPESGPSTGIDCPANWRISDGWKTREARRASY